MLLVPLVARPFLDERLLTPRVMTNLLPCRTRRHFNKLVVRQVNHPLAICRMLTTSLLLNLLQLNRMYASHGKYAFRQVSLWAWTFPRNTQVLGEMIAREPGFVLPCDGGWW